MIHRIFLQRFSIAPFRRMIWGLFCSSLFLSASLVANLGTAQVNPSEGEQVPSDFLEPSRISLRWLDDEYRSVGVITYLDKRDVEGCARAGLELEHRFLLKFCERLQNLGTACESEKRIIHNVTIDPIQDSYRVASDRLDDDEEPIVITFRNLDDARIGAATISSLPLSYVGRGEAFSRFLGAKQKPARDKKWLLGLRVRTTCKGEVPRFLADLSYFFTFGMVDLYGRDSGWEYFELLSEDRSTLVGENFSSQAGNSLPRSDLQ